MCASGVCTEGICRDALVTAGEVCGEDMDCATGACAFTSFPGSQSDIATCCASGEKVNHYGGYGKNFNYCTSLPAGTTCGNLNEMCVSGVCTEGICS